MGSPPAVRTTPSEMIRYAVEVAISISDATPGVTSVAIVKGVGYGHTPQDAYQEAYKQAKAAFAAMADAR